MLGIAQDGAIRWTFDFGRWEPQIAINRTPRAHHLPLWGPQPRFVPFVARSTKDAFDLRQAPDMYFKLTYAK